MEEKPATLHSVEIQETEKAEPMDLDLLQQLIRIQPADLDDEAMLSLINNVIQLGQGE